MDFLLKNLEIFSYFASYIEKKKWKYACLNNNLDNLMTHIRDLMVIPLVFLSHKINIRLVFIFSL